MLWASLLGLRNHSAAIPATLSLGRPQTLPSRFTASLELWLPQEVHKTFTTQLLDRSHKFRRFYHRQHNLG